MEEKKGFSKTDLWLLLAVIIWGSDFFFAKIALREVSPMNFAAMRTTISAIILVPLFIKREKNWLVSFKHFLCLVGLAFLGIFLTRVLMSVGLSLTTASNSALIMATSPIFVLIASSLFLRSEVTLGPILGILLSFLGVFLVIRGDWGRWSAATETFKGDIFMIAATISWAMFNTLVKRMLKEHSSLKVTAYVMFIGMILLSPFLPNDKAGGWVGISGLTWVSILFVAVMGNCLSYFLWIRGIQNIGPLRTVLYQYLMPVTTIILAVPFLNETLTVLQVLGAGVVFGGIFLARYERRIV